MLNSYQLLLDNRYRLNKLLGDGPHASVYQATDEATFGTVTVKVYDPRLQRDLAFALQFRDATRQAQLLYHPHVARVQAYGFADDSYYVVSQHVGGHNLQKHIALHQSHPAEILGLMQGAIRGLGFIHQHGWLHGGIKPSNLLLAANGRLMIADYGPRHMPGAGGVPITEAELAAIAYLSPEQIAGSALTPASDIYSLGVVLYEAVTGSLPFGEGDALTIARNQLTKDPAPPHERNDQVSESFGRCILHCLERDPDRRFATCVRLNAALDEVEWPIAPAPHEQPKDTRSGMFTRTPFRALSRRLTGRRVL